MALRAFATLAGLSILTLIIFLALQPWSPAGAVVVAGLAALAGSAALTHLATRPIHRAIDAATEVLRGDLRHRLPETPPGLIGDLYRALNRVAEELRSHVGEREADVVATQTLLREMSEGVLALEPDGTIARTNLALRRVLGGTERPEGKRLGSLIRNPELVAFLDPASVPTDGVQEEFEVFDRTILVSARRMPGGDVVAVFSDLTSIRRLETVRTEFVANASHELKTPLTAIRGYAETLLDADVAPEDRETFAARIVEHAERMAAIVDDLLTLARLEAPDLRPHRDQVRLRPLIQDVWEGLAERAADAGLSFSCQLEDDELAVAADREGVRQVLENLLDNAIRHSGGDEVGIRARRLSPETVQITCWDSGRGFPSDHLDRVFERFYRVDASRSRASGGTGLGLSIVKHWTESMGGRVRAESSVGEGTRVHVELPVAG